MGKRKRVRQPTMWVATTDLPTSASHPFYARLNHLLAEQGFDDFVEAHCAPFYATTKGRRWPRFSRSGRPLRTVGRAFGWTGTIRGDHSHRSSDMNFCQPSRKKGMSTTGW